MKLLVIDTSTDACCVGLVLGEQIVERVETGQQHGERLLAIVQELLGDAALALSQLDAVAFGRGPGSFTSLRIGAGAVQGLAFGADLPVIAVSSLAALAQGAEGSKVLAAVDARMQQVYFGEYSRADDGLMTLQGAESVVDPGAVPLPPGTGWVGVGSGWSQYEALLRARLGPHVETVQTHVHPRPGDLAALARAAWLRGEKLAPEQALPVYIRDDVANKR